MTGRTNDDETEGTSWSLLYAPGSALHPVVCAGCGNVFGAEAASCPWCGRSVVASPRLAARSIAVGESPEALAARPARAEAPPVTPSDGDGHAHDGQARRWAGVLVASGVLLAIGTGVAVRGRDGDNGGSAVATTTKPTVASATTALTATTTAAATTTDVSSATPVTTTAGTTATTVVATTAAPPVTTAAPAPTTTRPQGPSLSEPERNAVAVTQRLSDAIVAHEWAKVRTLAPNNSTTDEAYNRYWGSIEAATLVPTRVAANPDGTYAVYTGVISVTSPASGRTTTIACGRYVVDLKASTVVAVRTQDLRAIPGAPDVAGLSTELRAACNEPGF